MESELLTEFFGNGSQASGNWCYAYNRCTFHYRPCAHPHPDLRYTDSSAAWVLIASIIVFFMKAGFMLLEVAFARTVKEKRYVIVTKHQDAFASAFGFFLLGFDLISRYGSPQNIKLEFFGVTDPMVWFFKFTFASNTATIIGGCLVTNKYKLRLPAAFISAFVISGIIHPLVARIIWSDDCNTLSPYRFCSFGAGAVQQKSCGYNCTENMGFGERLYVLDFAGGGAVHLLGGVAGLTVCLFAKFQEWWDKRNQPNPQINGGGGGAEVVSGAEPGEEMEAEGFWDWMYPVHGGEETVSEAALGVTILWFCWFAFNCGSTESVEVGRPVVHAEWSDVYPYYGIPAVIAVNMIMAGASGGTTAIVIAMWAQVRNRTESVNANEIANGVLSSLVAITAGCAFVDYWGACLIGVFAVIFYHLGCFAEYKFGIKDTARVVPVHGVCGLWSLLAAGLFLVGDKADCNLHAAFEGLCYCDLRLPHLNYGERILAQLIGAALIICLGAGLSFVMYFTLYIIPISPFIKICEKLLFLNPGNKHPPLYFRGGWLLSHPDEDFDRMTGVQNLQHMPIDPEPTSHSTHSEPKERTRTHQSNLGTLSSNYGTVDSAPLGGGGGTATYSHGSTANSGGRLTVTFKGGGRRNNRNGNFKTDSQALLNEDDSIDPSL